MTISIDQPPESPFRLKLAGRNTFCGRIKDRLEFHPSFEILPHFATPSEPNLASAIDGAMPDIVLLSTNIPTRKYERALAALVSWSIRYPVVLTAECFWPDLSMLPRQFQPIIQGTLLDEMLDTPLLPLVLEGVAQGFTCLLPGPDKVRPVGLSEYELLILRLLALGQSTRQVAEGLENRSLDSVYSAQKQIRAKLGVDSTSQALMVAVGQGMVANFVAADDRQIGRSA